MKLIRQLSTRSLCVIYLAAVLGSSVFMFTPASFAEDHGAAVTDDSDGSFNEAKKAAYVLMGAAFALAIAASVGAIGQSRAASAALEGIARNPEAAGKIFTPLILSLALIESLVIYVLIIAFVWMTKV